MAYTPTSKYEARALALGQRSVRRGRLVLAVVISVVVPVAAVAYLWWLTATIPPLFAKFGDEIVPVEASGVQFLRLVIVGSIGGLMLVSSLLGISCLRQRRTYFTIIQKLCGEKDQSEPPDAMDSR